MIRRLLKRLPYLLWFLPGFLLWASFPPMGERFDCFFALAPIIWHARRYDARKNFLVWYANGFFFWFATLSWMPAIIKNGGPWPLVLLGWGCLSAYCALYFAAFGWLSARVWAWTRGRGYGWRLFAIVVAEPVLWAGLELIRSRFLGGFAWNQLGVAPINGGLGAPAALGGVYCVSAVVILVNGTLASIAERMLAPLEERIVPPLPPGASWPNVPPWVRSVETLVPFLLILGLYQVARPVAERDEGGIPVRFGLMQRDFPAVFQPPEDPRPAYEKMVANLMRTKPDILVLPESGFCEIGPVTSRGAVQFVESWLGPLHPSAVVTGGSRKDEAGRQYNSAAAYALFGTNVVDCQIYDKVHLVPFGEFIPGDKLIPALQRFAPVGSCTPGEIRLLNASVGGASVRLGPAICFEDTDSALVRELAARGAQVLVFITNDNWFAHSVEPEQHAWQAVARAVETGLPVVRTANSGVTGFVLPSGESKWLAGRDGRPLVDETGTICATLGLAASPRPTPYVRFGDWPLGLAFLLLITALGVIEYVNDYEKRRTLSL